MILYVNCCVREDSRTDRIARTLLEKLGGEYEEVYLPGADLKPLSRELLDKRNALIEKADYSDPMFRYAKQFAAADRIVISAPYWDLSFPAVLKLYIENIYVENGNLNYYSEKGILYYKSSGFVAAYPENNKTTDFHIPEGVTYAYSWYLLRDCRYVENVYVPQTATFNYSTMQYCDNLKNVFVDENNPLYCDIDGVMYSKDKTKLLLYPRGRNPSSISFPATVKEIDGCAFYKCKDLTNVVLPEKMVRVYGYEFLHGDIIFKRFDCKFMYYFGIMRIFFDFSCLPFPYSGI